MLRWIQWSLMGMAALMLTSTVVLGQDDGQGRQRRGGGRQAGRGPGGGGFGGQRGGGQRGGSTIRLSLLQVEAVQEEIDLLPDQADDIKKAVEASRTAGRGAQGGERPDFRNMSEEERTKMFAEFRERAAKAAKELDGKVDEILIPPQIERLNEIALQVQGPNAILQDKVSKELKITAAQKKKIEEAQTASQESMRTKIRELFQGAGRGGDRTELMKKFTDMRKEAGEALLGPLTADQKKQFEDMKGEPFKMPENALRGAGGGGRGGAGGRTGGRGGAGGRPSGGRPGGGRPGGDRPARPGSDDNA